MLDKSNEIKALVTEIIFNNINKYLSFIDLKKFLIPNNFRLVGLNLTNNNLFLGTVFAADACYFNKSYYEI